MKTKQLAIFFNFEEETGRVVSANLRQEQSAIYELCNLYQLNYHDIMVDLKAHKAFVEGCEVALTTTEFKLLIALIARQGQALSYREALGEVYGDYVTNDTKLVSNCIARLRDKIGFERIDNIRGYGYRIA